MSTASSTSTSPSNSLPIFNAALEFYRHRTNKDLIAHPLHSRLQSCNSPEAVLIILREQIPAFNRSQDRDDAFTKWVAPTVNVLYMFSATIGQSIGLAFPPENAIFASIGILLSASNDASASREKVFNILNRIERFFHRLYIYTGITPTTAMMDMMVEIMVELLKIFATVTKDVEHGRFESHFRELTGNRDIEDSLERLDKLTQEEARLASAELMKMTHGVDDRVKGVPDQMQDVRSNVQDVGTFEGRVLGDVQDVRDDVQDVWGDVQDIGNKVQSIDDRLQGIDASILGLELDQANRNQLRDSLLRWLSPPDPSLNHNIASKAHHNGTAQWFFEGSTFNQWKSTGSFLWVHGKPGSGKSVFCSSIIQDIIALRYAGKALLAYFYFDFRDADKQNLCNVLPSLLIQLSALSDVCCDKLSQLHSAHGRGVQKPSNHAMVECLKEMLVLEGQAPTYVILDALDECPVTSSIPSPREEVLELVEDLVGLHLPNLHICVTSRPEPDIQMVLEPLAERSVSLHDESGQNKDIADYVSSFVQSNRRMGRWREEDKDLVINTLSAKAGGMFRWVFCQLELLRHSFPPSVRHILEELPDSLDETYERILRDIGKPNQGHALRLLQCLIVAVRPLEVKELAEVLTFDLNTGGMPRLNTSWRWEDQEEAVTSACSSLVTIVKNGDSRVVQFSHFSVKEYLTSERLASAEDRLSYYHILPEPAHTFLAHACLSVLLRLDDKIDRKSIAHFPLASYAARHWVGHAHSGNVSANVQEAMERLFDSERPHFAAWVWLYDIDRHWIEPNRPTIHQTRPEAVPLYYASLCNFHGLMEYLIATYSPDLDSRGGSHRTPLHAASVKGHLGAAMVLLKCGADPNSRDKQGRAPLHRVSQGGHLVMPQSSLDVARLLVSFGADVNATDNQGRTPLHAAARSGYLDLVRLLHESGASLNVRNEDQETPLHLACGHGELNLARFLIDRGSDIKSQDKNGCIPLQIASRFGHVDVALLLLEWGSDINVRDTQHCTPLHYASQYGRLNLARLLLDLGADVNARDTQRRTPLHYASRYGRLDLVQLLIGRGADVNVHGVDHWTALHFVSYSGHLSIAKLLIKHGADVNSRKDKHETSLDLASRTGHLEIARILMESGAELTARDDDGWMPFHTASYFGHLHVAEFLLGCGIDVDTRNGNEETSLYLASSRGKVDVVRFLIEHGTDIHSKTKSGWNSVHIASQFGHLDIVRRLINTGIPIDIRNGDQQTPLALASRNGEVEVGRFLIERGADINTRDKRSRSPLHLATQYGHIDMARLLLDHGVDSNIQKDNFWSPLHLASAHGHLRVAELLVHLGARVDVSNGKKDTPLQLAAGNGKVEIARLLIDHGAALQTANNNGWTPLHSAARRGHLQVVRLLLQRGASVDALNKANKTAATLASENGQGEIAKFISQHKANAKDRTKTPPTTPDVSQYGADEGGKVDEDALLHTASLEGKVDVMRSLLEQGSNINARIAQHRTPLHVAAVKGNLEVVNLLIERGAEVDPCDMWGWVPLHFAARFGYLEVSRVLIDHGANVNVRNQDYWTPIHLSAGNGHLEIVKLLLERGTDVHVVNGEGETPYQISRAFGYGEIADLLLGTLGAR